MHTPSFDLVDEYYPIEVAIKNGDLAYARELLRFAHQENPTAETYYLSALVATTLDQRIALLQRALELNPNHMQAALALEQTQHEAYRILHAIKPAFLLTRISQALFSRFS